MNRPNFFIVGAPKCGTTALATYLSEHSDVFVSNPKEPHYFMHPDAGIRKIVDERHYLGLFSRAGEKKVIGEASVWYLYSDYARRKIKVFAPNAKIIILRRNPVDFVASFHSQLVFSGCEKYKDLAEAWYNRIGRYSPGEGETLEQGSNWITSYPEMIRFDKYINKYLNDFGQENVLVMDQEDLLADMRACYVHSLSFLGVAIDTRKEFPKINRNKAHRNELVRILLHFGGRQDWAVSVARRMKMLLGVGSFGIYKFISDLNLVNVKRPPVPESLRADILRYYEFVNND